MKHVAILDYGLGNIYGIQKACNQSNIKTIITNDKKKILRAEGLILPGVGAFKTAMNRLNELELTESIKSFKKTGKNIVGICLGMQLLTEKSYEQGETQGLGFVKGKITSIKKDIKGDYKIIALNTGWSTVEFQKKFENTNICKNLPKILDFYFVHSFWLKDIDDKYCLSKSRFMDEEYCSSFKKENIIGFQFHPENSGYSGLTLLKNSFSYIL